MRSLSLLLAGMLVGGAATAADLPALPPPPPLPAENPAPASSAASLPLPPALGTAPAANADADLPSLPPPPPEPDKKTAVNAPAKPAAKPAPAALDNALSADLPALPAEPTVKTAAAPVAGGETGGTSGFISGGRVNVRAGDSTRYEIVFTADPETPVTVYEKKGEWVKIGFPEKEFCYVEQRAVDGQIPADFPEEGVACTVRAENAKIYVRPWAGSTAVGTLKAGETLTVTGARGQYLRIRPPAGAYAWVFEKYIRYNKEEVQTVELTEEEKAARAKENEEALKNTVDGLKNNKGRLAAARENNPLLLKLRERTAAERKQRDAQREAAKAMLANLDKQMDAIDAETAARIADIDRNRVDMAKLSEEAMRAAEENYRPGPPPGSLGNSATGWIEHVAFWRGRPAEYRLVKGQEIICYIRSGRYNLADYNGRRVVVTGNVERAPKGNLNVLNVETLRLFDQSRVEMPTDLRAAAAPVAPAAAVASQLTTNNADDLQPVGVIRSEGPAPSVYREENMVRPLDRDAHVVTLQERQYDLNQNDSVIIIEDTPGGAYQMRVGDRVDVTGMGTPAR